MSEAAFQRIVIFFATKNGWKYYHPPDNIPRRNGAVQNIVAGYPDLTLVKDNRLIFAELKRNKGKVSLKQEQWLNALSKAGAETYVWKPENIKEIQNILS